MKKLLLALVGMIVILGFIYLGFIKNNDHKKEESTTTTTELNVETKTKDEGITAPHEEETTPQSTGSKFDFDGYTPSATINGLPTDIISLGYSRDNCDRDEFNRPVYIENIQQQYGDKYNAVFIEDESQKVIYLTYTMGYEYYNDGVANVDVLMNTLKSKNVPAVFFVDGGYVRNNPDLCKKIVDNGFKVGCHGWDHPAEGVATYSVEVQIEDAKQIYNHVFEATGVEPYLYRFGSGIWNERALALLSELGFKNVFYSFSYYDYDPEDQPDEASTLQMMLDNLHNGEILYLHTVSNTSMHVISQFIDGARAQGYEFGTIE